MTKQEMFDAMEEFATEHPTITPDIVDGMRTEIEQLWDPIMNAPFLTTACVLVEKIKYDLEKGDQKVISFLPKFVERLALIYLTHQAKMEEPPKKKVPMVLINQEGHA